MFHFEKASLYWAFFVLQCLLLFACAATNQNFRMTGIEDTHLTPAVLLFQVEVNNALFFAIIDIREKICRVSVPVGIYNSLAKQCCLDATIVN